MPLPDGFLQELVARNPLEDVVRQYADVKRAGSNLVCRCPFHSEKTPSFTIYSNPSHFYCYGCGAGGDVVTFVKRIENLDFMGAVEYLANRANMPMPQQVPGEIRVDKKRYYDMNAQAARFWHKILLSPEGKKGLDYLTGRGLTLPVITRFGLGYAPDSFDMLTKHLTELGYREKEIKENFLGGVSAKTGKLFDFFRNRVVFPIIDVAGNVVAFSGRFVGEMGPNDRKYFNTNDTPVFKKSRHVFALNLAKNSPDKEFVLCEGNMDAVSLHAAGITNAVASLGTALTGDQCRLLARFTDKIALCYDGDAAGKKATQKAIRLLNAAGIRVRVIELPEKGPAGEEIKDPDDFIRIYGKGGFLSCLEKAKGSSEYLFQQIEAQNDLSTMDGKLAFSRDVVAFLAQLDSAMERELFVRRAASVTGLSVEVIQTQAGKKYRSERAEEAKRKVDETVRRSRGFGDRVNPDKAKFAAQASKEEAVLGILLLRPENLINPATRAELDPELFRCEFTRRALEALLALSENGEEPDLARLNERFSPEEMAELEKLRRRRREMENNSPQVLEELFRRLLEDREKSETAASPLSSDWLEKIKKQKTDLHKGAKV